jgi:[protein-PII] uridylyltransferase
MARRPTPEFTTSFVESLPRAYAEKYPKDVILAHAGVSFGRTKGQIAVGLFGKAGNGLCVAADDRPGLLSVISGALVLSSFDVNHAEVFTRLRTGSADTGREAVDLFWVRKLDAPPGASLVQADAERFQAMLVEYLGAPGDLRSAVEKRLNERAAAGPPKPVDATVRFVADAAGGLATLEVETGDRSGLLFSLASALFGQRVQILESEVHTENDRVFDRFRIVEFNGTPIDAARRLEIQVAVLTAMEPARRSVPPPP